MKIIWLATLFVVGTALVEGAGRAEAQYGANPRSDLVTPQNYDTLQRPTVSPYLNLLRRGGGIGFNYETLVKPELQLRQNLQQQQQQTQRLSQQTNQIQQLLLNPYTQPGADPRSGAARTIRQTGHTTGMMNLEGRFLTR